MFLDSGWLSESLDEILASHMIQEKLPCPHAEGLWVIVHSPVSPPLSSAVTQDLLGCELAEEKAVLQGSLY